MPDDSDKDANKLPPPDYGLKIISRPKYGDMNDISTYMPVVVSGSQELYNISNIGMKHEHWQDKYSVYASKANSTATPTGYYSYYL